ncbi:hypothetical protein TIFTF001_038704 [Ficus carica]|uniref:F-box domain-containing protein n=1 Tax=Ficus carica TaxID=3494 RepID=A0AA88E7R0_FICCA|nr:hypothetical protein TIFTF001_038704 [Ficus carica]
MDGKIEEMDRISNLPDFILHRILSFLPRRYAVRTSVLSKQWSSVWDSFPIFVFSENMYAAAAADRSTPVYKEKVREFINLVDKAVQKFVQKKLQMERLSLSMGSVDHNFVSMIYRWILLALNNGVQEISISDIIRSCSNINYLALEHFYGPRTVQISKLDKLESVSIVDALPKGQLDNISVDAPKLKYLNFDPYDQSNFLFLRIWPLPVLLYCKGLEFLDDNSRPFILVDVTTLRVFKLMLQIYRY